LFYCLGGILIINVMTNGIHTIVYALLYAVELILIIITFISRIIRHAVIACWLYIVGSASVTVIIIIIQFKNRLCHIEILFKRIIKFP
jgi:hypothetical protein